MRKSPGRKKAREDARGIVKRSGDLSRKSTHKMKTSDGMVASKHFKRTSTGLVKV
jgi:predicted neuraminidase